MNCTYKTNWYRLSLLIISKITFINFTFYITFAFQVQEKEEDYTFVMKHLKVLLISLNLFDSVVILIDCEKMLMNSLSAIYSETHNLLCLWYINKNVIIYIKKETTLSEQEMWNTKESITSEVQKMMKQWYTVLYSFTDQKFHK